jgi:hypothetical protein
MSMAPLDDQTDADNDTGKQDDAMKDRLRKDVASWSAARSGTHSRDAAEAVVAVPAQPAEAATAARAKRRKAVAPEVAKPADVAGKPFRMSYDGMSEADYISYIIQRGA